MNTVIDIRELSKSYDKRAAPALDNLTLTVERGEIFGYLGPNGAGKTTTIRLLLDLIRPSAGSMSVLGLDVQRQSTAVRSQIGYLPGELSLWDHLTGRDVLRYMAGLRPGSDMRFARELAERLHLDLDARVRSYSTGNRRKVGIIQALMHHPPLLILDEPTTGLDPLMRQTFNAILREARADGQTVFLSSHVLSEVEAVCDRVAMLRNGRLRQIMHISDLRSVLARTVTIYSSAPMLFDGWNEVPGVQSVAQIPNAIRLQVVGSLDAVIKRAAFYPVEDLRVEHASLEQIFMEQYDD
jgi:ABC-2 type transport system ATP-binding protein